MADFVLGNVMRPLPIGEVEVPCSYSSTDVDIHFKNDNDDNNNNNNNNVTSTLEQATKAQRGSTGIALLFL